MNRYIRRRRLTIVHRNAAEEKAVAVQYFQLMSAPERGGGGHMPSDLGHDALVDSAKAFDIGNVSPTHVAVSFVGLYSKSAMRYGFLGESRKSCM